MGEQRNKPRERERIRIRARNGAEDPLVVPTKELARIIREWENKFRADHPKEKLHWTTKNNREESKTSTFRSAHDAQSYGAHQYLADQADVESEEAFLRTLQRVKRCETRWTSFCIADEILTSMGYTVSMFTELSPVANPRWSREKWEAYKITQGGCENNGGGFDT
jgi:hypothetical protein